jgi:hypothetical protein
MPTGIAASTSDRRTPLNKYRKALVAVAGVCAVIGKILADGEVNLLEAGELVGAIGLAYTVWRVPNEQ